MLPRWLHRSFDRELHQLDELCVKHKQIRSSDRLTRKSCFASGEFWGVAGLLLTTPMSFATPFSLSPLVLCLWLFCSALSLTLLIVGVSPSRTGANRALLTQRFAFTWLTIGAFSSFFGFYPGIPVVLTSASTAQSYFQPTNAFCLAFLAAGLTLTVYAARLASSSLEFDRRTRRLNELWFLRESGLLESES